MKTLLNYIRESYDADLIFDMDDLLRRKRKVTLKNDFTIDVDSFEWMHDLNKISNNYYTEIKDNYLVNGHIKIPKGTILEYTGADIEYEILNFYIKETKLYISIPVNRPKTDDLRKYI